MHSGDKIPPLHGHVVSLRGILVQPIQFRNGAAMYFQFPTESDRNSLQPKSNLP